MLFEKKTLEVSYLVSSVHLSEKALLPVLEKIQLGEDELMQEMKAEIKDFTSIYNYCHI